MNAKKDIKTKLEQLTLLLIYMTSWEEREHKTLPPVRRAWKGYDFDMLNDLEDQGYISQSKTAKSLYLTEEGVERAKKLEAILEKLPPG